jgi:hypothetical protein
MSSIFDRASFIWGGNAPYQNGFTYAMKPLTGNGQIPFTRNSNKWVVNKNGILTQYGVNEIAQEYDANGNLLGALIEPSATNLLLRSEEIETSSWVKYIQGAALAPVVTANDGIAPNGTQTADKVVLNLNGATSSNDFSWIFQNLVRTAGVAEVFSVYIKAFSSIDVGKVFRITGSTTKNVTLTNTWQRVDLIATTALSTTYSYGIRLRGGEGTADTVSFYMWGAQLETGSVATSYIPTTTASATRNEDVCAKTGVADVIGQSEGTIWVECNFNRIDPSIDRIVVELSDGTANNRVALTKYRTNRIQYYIRKEAVDQVVITPFTVFEGSLQIVARYEENNSAIFVNGVNIGEDLSCSIPNTPKISIGVRFDNNPFNNLNDHISFCCLIQRSTNGHGDC